MIKLYFNNLIRIENCPSAYLREIKKTLTLPNPKYYMLQKMKKSLWGVNKEFKYFEESGGEDLLVPRGVKSRLLAFLKASGLDYTYTTNFVSKRLNLTLKNIVLRDYQEELLNKMGELPSEGIFNLSTGSGKTIVALETIKRLNKTATVLVPNNVLVKQFYEECKKFLDYEPGVINGIEKNIKPISIATFQTLGRDEELLKKLVENTSVLIIDECQGAPAEGRRKIIQSFRPEYLFGLSATPEREDGQSEGVKFLCGEIIGEHKMTVLKPKVHVIENKNIIKMHNDYHQIIKDLVEDDDRNTLLAGLVLGELTQNRKVLVLTKRIAHYEKLKEKFDNIEGLYFISSKDPDRNKTLHEFKQGKKDFKAIFGTTSLLAVGTDIPSLDTLIIACDMKSKILTGQSCGRILRIFEGKPTPQIYDITDSANVILFSQAKKRLQFYKKQSWPIFYNGLNSGINRIVC